MSKREAVRMYSALLQNTEVVQCHGIVLISICGVFVEVFPVVTTGNVVD